MKLKDIGKHLHEVASYEKKGPNQRKEERF